MRFPPLIYLLALCGAVATGCATSRDRGNGAVQISQAMGQAQNRLPCNRSASPHCDLRIYQINVGTFIDASPDHGPSDGYGPGPHSGDLEGVISALDHIQKLGFNAIWLTPIFDSRAGEPQARPDGSAHVDRKLDGTGYFARDYFKIDPQFGTLEQAQRLVQLAHARGMKVIFDGVFGHHKGALVPSPTGLLPVDATSLSAYDGRMSTYPGRIVDYSEPKSTAFFKEVARYWIETLGIDGWRFDQVYQVPAAPLRTITDEITAASTKQYQNSYVVGEMWGDAAAIAKVLGSSEAPALSSVFDFPTRYALVQVLASDENGARSKPASSINQDWALGAHATYPDHAIMNFMLGNHDLVRFGDLIERARKGSPSDASYWARHKMAFTFLAAWSGPITLYYGEEFGAEVAGFADRVTKDCVATGSCDDHVARSLVLYPGINARAGAGSPAATVLKNHLIQLMTLRQSHKALSSGSRTHLYSDKSLYLDLKSDGGERFILAMNVGETAKTISLLPAALGMKQVDTVQIASGAALAQVIPDNSRMSLTLPPLSASLIQVSGE